MNAMDRICLARSNFIRKFHTTPNTVYLGQNDFFELKSSVNFLNLFSDLNEAEQKIMDMKIILVHNENYISVGYHRDIKHFSPTN